LKQEIEILKQSERRLTEDLRIERDHRLNNNRQMLRQFNKIQEMRAFQQTVQTYTQIALSPCSPRNNNIQKATASPRLT